MAWNSIETFRNRWSEFDAQILHDKFQAIHQLSWKEKKRSRDSSFLSWIHRQAFQLDWHYRTGDGLRSGFAYLTQAEVDRYRFGDVQKPSVLAQGEGEAVQSLENVSALMNIENIIWWKKKRPTIKVITSELRCRSHHRHLYAIKLWRLAAFSPLMPEFLMVSASNSQQSATSEAIPIDNASVETN